MGYGYRGYRRTCFFVVLFRRFVVCRIWDCEWIVFFVVVGKGRFREEVYRVGE